MGWGESGGHVYGREVKLGYGYDQDLQYIYPFKCYPLQIKVKKSYEFFSSVDCVNSEINDLNGYLGLFLYDEVLKYYNFLDKYDNDEYYLIKLGLDTRSEEYPCCYKYPNNIHKYIKKIDYGINIYLCIQKNTFSHKVEYEIANLLKSVYDNKDFSKLTSEQLETKCEILMNFKRKRCMTLKQIFQFFWDQRNIQKYQSPIRLDALPNPNSNTNNLAIENNNELGSLMYNLYIFYQKIETFFAKNSKVYEIQDEYLNFNQLQIKLGKCKNSFENVDEDDVIEMYKISKKLFKCYQVYLDYMFKNRFDVVDEETEVYESWIGKLRNSSTKMSMYCDENYILLDVKNMNFGRGKIKSVKHLMFNHPTSSTLENWFKKCPSKICNVNDEFRRWKCSICDEFAKIETVECNCGDKQFEELKFYCEDKAKKIIFEKLNQIDEKDKNYSQVKILLDLLSDATGKKFIDTLILILNLDINEEVNEGIKEYLYISLITELNNLFKEESENEEAKIGYIKSFSIPQKMLNDNVENVNYLFVKCPLSDECEDEKLKPHFCFECISYSKIKTLKCKCGEKGFNNSHFICDNEEHIEKFEENVKNLIFQQLDKNTDDVKVKSFLKFIKKTDTDMFDERMLKLLQTLNLDGDAKQIVNEYIVNFRT